MDTKSKRRKTSFDELLKKYETEVPQQDALLLKETFCSVKKTSDQNEVESQKKRFRAESREKRTKEKLPRSLIQTSVQQNGFENDERCCQLESKKRTSELEKKIKFALIQGYGKREALAEAVIAAIEKEEDIWRNKRWLTKTSWEYTLRSQAFQRVAEQLSVSALSISRYWWNLMKKLKMERENKHSNWKFLPMLHFVPKNMDEMTMLEQRTRRRNRNKKDTSTPMTHNFGCQTPMNAPEVSPIPEKRDVACQTTKSDIRTSSWFDENMTAKQQPLHLVDAGSTYNTGEFIGAFIELGNVPSGQEQNPVPAVPEVDLSSQLNRYNGMELGTESTHQIALDNDLVGTTPGPEVDTGDISMSLAEEDSVCRELFELTKTIGSVDELLRFLHPPHLIRAENNSTYVDLSWKISGFEGEWNEEGNECDKVQPKAGCTPEMLRHEDGSSSIADHVGHHALQTETGRTVCPTSRVEADSTNNEPSQHSRGPHQESIDGGTEVDSLCHKTGNNEMQKEAEPNSAGESGLTEGSTGTKDGQYDVHICRILDELENNFVNEDSSCRKAGHGELPEIRCTHLPGIGQDSAGTMQVNGDTHAGAERVLLDLELFRAALRKEMQRITENKSNWTPAEDSGKPANVTIEKIRVVFDEKCSTFCSTPEFDKDDISEISRLIKEISEIGGLLAENPIKIKILDLLFNLSGYK